MKWDCEGQESSWNFIGKHDVIKINKIWSNTDHFISHKEQLFHSHIPDICTQPITFQMATRMMTCKNWGLSVDLSRLPVNQFKEECLLSATFGIIFICEEQNMNYIFKLCESVKLEL